MTALPLPAIALGLVFCLFTGESIVAQNSYSITEQSPALAAGLEMGFHIKNEKEKDVGNQGPFSRYAVQFYITNTTAEAKLLMRKQGFTILNDPSPELVRFDITNATGARLTSKRVSLQASPCNVMAVVEDKDCNSNKTVQNKRIVNVGYWIRPGETVRADVIVIVPFNEQPNVQATLLMGGNALLASASFDQSPPPQQAYGSSFNVEGFVHLASDWHHTYLNIEKGPLDCGNVDMEWWSAQWQMLPVPGTPNFVLKNRWKEYCISFAHPGTKLSPDYNALASQWIPEALGNNRYRFKNAADGFYLYFNANTISTTLNANDPAAVWIVEP